MLCKPIAITLDPTSAAPVGSTVSMSITYARPVECVSRCARDSRAHEDEKSPWCRSKQSSASWRFAQVEWLALTGGHIASPSHLHRITCARERAGGAMQVRGVIEQGCVRGPVCTRKSFSKRRLRAIRDRKTRGDVCVAYDFKGATSRHFSAARNPAPRGDDHQAIVRIGAVAGLRCSTATTPRPRRQPGSGQRRRCARDPARQRPSRRRCTASRRRR